MIHRDSGVLCDATSLALNVFDILKGDAIRGEGWTRTNHWINVVQRCGLQEEDSNHQEKEEKSCPGGWSKQSAYCIPVNKKQRPECRLWEDRKAITCSGGKGCRTAPASEKTGKTGHEDNPWTPAHPTQIPSLVYSHAAFSL